MTAALVEPFGLPAGHYRAILADPPWHFQAWASPPYGLERAAESHYHTMTEGELSPLPVPISLTKTASCSCGRAGRQSSKRFA